MGSKRDGKLSDYSEEKMRKLEIGNFRTFEYHFPFQYENVNVVREYVGGETHGLESNPINSCISNSERKSSDYIEIQEDHGIVYVEVIGSACTPPGFVMLSAEPMDDFRRADEIDGIMPVRFRINNLWGMHLRADQWLAKNIEVTRKNGELPYQEIPAGFIEKKPHLKGCRMKLDYREVPFSGMSCAIFSIPRSKKVKIMAGSEIMGWPDDNFPDDAHYSIRIIRVTVCDVLNNYEY